MNWKTEKKCKQSKKLQAKQKITIVNIANEVGEKIHFANNWKKKKKKYDQKNINST